MKRRMNLLPLVLFGLCEAGCTSQEVFQLTSVPRGEVTTPGVVIQAADGAFTLAAGQQFVPPAAATNCPVEPSPHNWETVRSSATRVIVRHPAARVPLHGLLVFCAVPPTTEAQGQVHTIKISDDRIPQTSTMANVVWDDVTYPWLYRDDSGGVSEISGWPTWILWLGEQPY